MGRLASSVPLRFDDQNQNHSFLMGIAALNPSYELAVRAKPVEADGGENKSVLISASKLVFMVVAATSFKSYSVRYFGLMISTAAFYSRMS
jgi:hypothetical protein